MFGWEQAALAFPGYLKKFTVAYYLQALVPHAMPNDTALSLIQGIFRETPPLADEHVLAGSDLDYVSGSRSLGCGAQGIRAGAINPEGRPAVRNRTLGRVAEGTFYRPDRYNPARGPRV